MACCWPPERPWPSSPSHPWLTSLLWAHYYQHILVPLSMLCYAFDFKCQYRRDPDFQSRSLLKTKQGLPWDLPPHKFSEKLVVGNKSFASYATPFLTFWPWFLTFKCQYRGDRDFQSRSLLKTPSSGVYYLRFEIFFRKIGGRTKKFHQYRRLQTPPPPPPPG